MEPFKKPNVQGPKYRPSSLNVFRRITTLKPKGRRLKFFSRMKIVYPNLEKYPNTVIKDLIYRFNKDVLLEQIACTREGVELPANLGHIFLGTLGFASNEFHSLNLGLSVKMGVKVPFASNHTDGNYCRVYYSNCAVKMRFENAKYWGFNACSRLSDRCAQEYSKHWQKYFRVTKKNYISKFIRGIPPNWKYLTLPTY